jgi:hypothetical protein
MRDLHKATTPTHLAGIEYIISPALSETLDMEERQLWHSHSYEVSSGSLIEPGMPASIDLAIMEVLVGDVWENGSYMEI